MDSGNLRKEQLSLWLDERTGWRSLLRRFLDEPIRGGARWAYVLGSALVFLFLLQAFSGILLSLYYVPSADHAHASVAYIQKAVPGGALVRGLHHYGASAMVILVVAHLAQALFFGSYKGKRELLWMAGVLLMILIFGLAFTGYLLPWDQAAYYGTKVGTAVAGEAPVFGPLIERLMLGGSELTSLTLSRFFTAHVFLLPLAVVLLIVLHIALFRRAGAAGPYHHRDDWRVERFYPRQVFKNAAFGLIILLLLLGLSRWRPAELGPQADPATDYLARPAWYFLPLFQLLKYFPGKSALIPSVILPTLLIAALFLWPFWDRHAERDPRRRPLTVGMFSLILIGAIGLTILSRWQDHRDPTVRAQLRQQDLKAHVFLQSPFQPQEIMSGESSASAPELANIPAPPTAFTVNCADCHGSHGQGGEVGPSLIGVSAKPKRSPKDLKQLLNNPRAFGIKYPMPDSFSNISAEEKRQIVEWLSKSSLTSTLSSSSDP